MRKHTIEMVLTTAILTTLAAHAPAATMLWDGGNGNFNAATNWDTDTLPGAGDVADTNTTTNNTIIYPQSTNGGTNPYTLGGLMVRSGDTFTFNTGLTDLLLNVTATLTNEGTLTISNNSNTNARSKVLDYQGAGMLNTGTINVTALTNAGANRHARLLLSGAGATHTNQGTINITGNSPNQGQVSVTGANALFINQSIVNIANAGESLFTLNGNEYRQTAGTTTVGTTAGSGARLNAGASGPININGGVLKGTGIITGVTTIGLGGTLAPGASVGTLEIAGNVTINGTLEIELDGLLADLLKITGASRTMTLNGTVNVKHLTAPLNSEYLIATASGAGSLIALGAYTVTGDGAWNVELRSADQELWLVPIPEPASLLLLAAGGMLMLPRRARKG